MNMMTTKLRELTAEELVLVSGGSDTIVVTGQRDNWGSSDFWSSYDDYYNDYTSDYYGGGGGGVESPIPEEEKEEPEIVVTGPPRMADEWSELDLGDQLQWLSAFLFSNGNDQFADIVTGSDLSGENPDNPYQSEEEARRDYATAAEAAAEAWTDLIPQP
jgi:hypothetical protein